MNRNIVNISLVFLAALGIQSVAQATPPAPKPTFPGAKETFYGLSADGSAYVTVTLANKGNFTGKVTTSAPKAGFSLSGKLVVASDTSTSGTFTKSTGKNPYTVVVSGTAYPDYFASVTYVNGTITAYPAVPVAKSTSIAEVGDYTLLASGTALSGTTTPLGTSFASISVAKSGVSTVKTTLADGTGFTASGGIVTGTSAAYVSGTATVSGTVPTLYVFAPTVYSGKGLVSGTVSFSGTGPITASLDWTKPASAHPTPYYPLGFGPVALSGQGNLYTKAALLGLLPITSGTLTTTGTTAGFAIAADKKVTFSGSGTKLSVGFGDGSVSGTIDIDGTKTKYSGLILLDGTETSAAGYYLTKVKPATSGTGLSEDVSITLP